MNVSSSASTTDNEKATARRDTAPPDSKSRTIEVTPKAATAIRRQLVKRGTPDASLRVGLRGGGCSGFTYVIEFHDGPPKSRDIVIDTKTEAGEDVRVVVDPKSLLYLSGSTLEWEQTLLKQGFKFVNPHEKSGCGCGHSFDV
jgi:iron-sulfur cluster assembly protein